MIKLSKQQRRLRLDEPDAIRAAIKRMYPAADEDGVDYALQRWLHEHEDELQLRPLSMVELVDRWGHADAVGAALLAGHLRPLDGYRMLRFSWKNIRAIEGRYTIRTEQAHPDRQHRRAPNREYTLREAYKEYLGVKRRREQAFARQASITIDIYFIEAMGADICKIGKATDVQSRFRSLRTMSAQPLRLVALDHGPHELERDLHREFAEDRSHGEWFRMSPALRERVQALRQANGLPDWARKLERSRISREAHARRKAAAEIAA